MPYTTHGHWYGPGEPTKPGPRLVAKCMGTHGCAVCRAEATTEPTPADEIRQAAAKVRAHAEIFGGAAEEIATLLDTVADAMDELGAVEGSASKAVHPTTPLGLGAPNRPWTAALATARAINGSQS